MWIIIGGLAGFLFWCGYPSPTGAPISIIFLEISSILFGLLFGALVQGVTSLADTLNYILKDVFKWNKGYHEN